MSGDQEFEFNAPIYGEAIKQKYRFATHMHSHVIYVYTDGIYEPIGEEVIREEARKMLGEEATEHRVNEIVAHIRETTFTPPEKFNPPLELVNLENGILNIFTGELLPHTPDIIFLNKLPVRYDPNASCPKIMQFLSEVVDEDNIPLLQEIAGYCLLRDYPFARAVMLVGNGNNGKSTFLNLLMRFLGEKNVASPSLQSLIYNRFSVAELFGKLACIHADIPNQKLTQTGMFKMLTGNDRIFADVKMKKPFEFKNYAKLLFSANELPPTNDTSIAFWRRWILIRFPNTFPEGGEKTDPEILKKLTTPEELSGFLNWALEGLKRLLDQKGFTMTKSEREVEREWVARSDSLRAFVMDYVERGDGWTSKDDFYQAYTRFCEEHDLVAIEKAAVGRRLPALVRTSEIHPLDPRTQKRCRAWNNVILKPPYEKFSYIADVSKRLTDFVRALSSSVTGVTDVTEFSYSLGQKFEGTIYDKRSEKIVSHPLHALRQEEEGGKEEGPESQAGSGLGHLLDRLVKRFGFDNPFTPADYADMFSPQELVKLSELLQDLFQRGMLVETPEGLMLVRKEGGGR